MENDLGFGSAPEGPKVPDLANFKVDQELNEQSRAALDVARQVPKDYDETLQSAQQKLAADAAARDFRVAFQEGGIQRVDTSTFNPISLGLEAIGGEPSGTDIQFGRGPQSFVARGYKMRPGYELPRDPSQGVRVAVQTMRHDGSVLREDVAVLPGYESVLRMLPQDNVITKEKFEQIAKSLDESAPGQYTRRLFDPEELALNPDNLVESLATLEEQIAVQREDELRINARKRFLTQDPESYVAAETGIGQYLVNFKDQFRDLSFFTQKAAAGVAQFGAADLPSLASFAAAIQRETVGEAYSKIAHRLDIPQLEGLTEALNFSLEYVEKKTDEHLERVEKNLGITLSTADRDSFAFAFGQGGAQMVVQIGVGAILAPAKLGFVGFAVTGAGFSGAMFFRERKKYYKSAGFVDENGELSEEGRQMALTDGLVAAGITYLTEQTTGGLGRLIQKVPGFGPLLTKTLARDMDIFVKSGLGKTAAGLTSSLAAGAARESFQESLDSVTRRTFTTFVRRDPESLGNFWSDEYMRQLLKEAQVAAAVGGPTGPVGASMSFIELMRHNPIAVGDTMIPVVTANYEGGTVPEVTEDNLQEVQAAYLRGMRLQQLTQQTRFSNRAGVKGTIALLNHLRGLSNPQRAGEFLAGLKDADGNRVLNKDQINAITDAMRNSDGKLDLSDIFGDSNTSIPYSLSPSGLSQDGVIGLRKVELAAVAPDIVAFIIETMVITGGKVDSKKFVERARAMGQNELADFFESMSATELLSFSGLAKESMTRVREAEEQAVATEAAGADIETVTDPEVESSPDFEAVANPEEEAEVFLEELLADYYETRGLTTEGEGREGAESAADNDVQDWLENGNVSFALLGVLMQNYMQEFGDTDTNGEGYDDWENTLRNEMRAEEGLEEAADEASEELPPVVSPEEEVEEEIEDYEEGEEPLLWSRGATSEATDADTEAKEEGVSEPAPTSRLGAFFQKIGLGGGKVVAPPSPAAQRLQDHLRARGIFVVFVDGTFTEGREFLATPVDGAPIYVIHAQALQSQKAGIQTALQAVVAHEAWHTFVDNASDEDMKKAISNAFSGDQDALLAGFAKALASEPKLREKLEKLLGRAKGELVPDSKFIDRTELMEVLQKLFEFSDYKWSMDLPLAKDGATNRLLEETMAYYIEMILVNNPAKASEMFAAFTDGLDYADVSKWFAGVLEKLGIRSFADNFPIFGRYMQIANILAEVRMDDDINPDADKQASQYQEMLRKAKLFKGVALEELKITLDEALAKTQVLGRSARSGAMLAAMASVVATYKAGQLAGRGATAVGRGAVAGATAFGRGVVESATDNPFAGLLSDAATKGQRLSRLLGISYRKAKRLRPDQKARREMYDSLLKRTRLAFTPTSSDPEGLTRLEAMLNRRREAEKYNERTGTKGFVGEFGVGGRFLGIDEDILDAPSTIDEVLEDPRFSRGVDPSSVPFELGTLGFKSRRAGLFGGLDTSSEEVFADELGLGTKIYREGKTVSAAYRLHSVFEHLRDGYLEDGTEFQKKNLYPLGLADLEAGVMGDINNAVDKLTNDPFAQLFIAGDLTDGGAALKKRAKAVVARHVNGMQKKRVRMGSMAMRNRYADMMTELLGTVGYTIRADELTSGTALELVEQINSDLADRLKAFAMFAPNQLQNQLVYVTSNNLAPASNRNAGFFLNRVEMDMETAGGEVAVANMQVTYSDISPNVPPHVQRVQQKVMVHTLVHELTHQFTFREMFASVRVLQRVLGMSVSPAEAEALRSIVAGNREKGDRFLAMRQLRTALEGRRKSLDTSIVGYLNDLEKRIGDVDSDQTPEQEEQTYEELEQFVSFLATVDLANSYVLALAAANMDKVLRSPPFLPPSPNDSVEMSVRRNQAERRIKDVREFLRTNPKLEGNSALEYVALEMNNASAPMYGYTNLGEYVAELMTNGVFANDVKEQLAVTADISVDDVKPEPLFPVEDALNVARALQKSHPLYAPESDAMTNLLDVLEMSSSIYATDQMSTYTLAESRSPQTRVRFSKGVSALYNPGTLTQGRGSAATSIKYKQKMPQLMNKRYADIVKFVRGGTNADIGGGKYDDITRAMKRRFGVKNVVYDPYNRDIDHNIDAANMIRGAKSDTATLSNVLNVIETRAQRELPIVQAADAIKLEGAAYFTMYNSKKKGTTYNGDSYQVAEDNDFYLPEIKKYFEEVEVVGGKNGVVIARRPKKDAVAKFADKLESNRKSKGVDPTNFFFQGNEIDSARINPNLRRTKRFRAAMGESKVKDILYHGTFKEFSDPLVFDPSMSQIGIHLSDNPTVARGFSGSVQNFTDPRVYALYADIRNPVTLPDLSTWRLDSLMDALETEIKKNYSARHKQILKVHGSYEAYFESLAEQYSSVDYMALRRVDHMDPTFMQFILKDLGFDGIRYMNRYEPGVDYSAYTNRLNETLDRMRGDKKSREYMEAYADFYRVEQDYAKIRDLMKRRLPLKDGLLGGRISGRYIVSDEVIRKDLREFARKYPEAIVNPDSYSYIAIDSKQLYSAVGDGRMTNDVNIAYSRGVGDVKALTTEQLRSAAKRVKRFSVKNLTYQRGIPASVLRKSVERDGKISAEIDRAVKLNQVVWRKVVKKFRRGEEREIAMGEVNRLLQMPVEDIDSAVTSVPLTTEMREIIKNMRSHIDSLSRRIAATTGLVPEEMATVISDNIGFYLTRKYAAFSEPDWASKVDPEVRSRMRSALHHSYRKFFEDAAKENPYNPDGTRNNRYISEEQQGEIIEQLMDDILYRAETSDSPMAFSAAVGGTKAGTIFMRRKLVERDKAQDVAKIDKKQEALDEKLVAKKISKKKYQQETDKLQKERAALDSFDYEGNNELVQSYRAFLGESTDPTANYANSVTKMITSLETFSFNQSLVELGLEEGFLFRGNEESRPAKLVPFDSLADSDPLRPFKGLYAEPEVKESIELLAKKTADYNTSGPIIRLLLRFNAGVKFGKTVLSPETHVRNVVGNISFMVGNGYLNEIFTAGRSIKKALRTVTQGNSIFLQPNKEAQRRYQDLLELGVVDTSDYTEIEQLWGTSGDSDMESVMSRFGEIRRAGGKVLDVFSGAYKAQDDFFKVIAFDIELARLRAAYPDRNDDLLKAEAAEIVTNTVPTYSRVPEAIKYLRYIPFLGTFPSFTAELIRTSIGRIAITRKELASDNPAVRKIGRSRLMGMGMLMVVPAILATAMRSISGVDEEEERAVRGMLPFWNKDSVLLFYRKEGGELSFINYGYVDPFVYFRQPFLALFGRNDETISNRMFDAVEHIFRPFIGKEIGYSALVDLMRGQDEMGRPLFDPGSDTASFIRQAGEHLFGATMPGAVKTFERLMLAANDHVDDYGKRYDLSSQVMQLLSGFKFETINPKQAFMFKVSEFNRLDRELRARMNRVVRTQGEITQGEIEDAVQYYNANRRALQVQLHSHVRSMRAFDITDGELRAILKANYISENLTEDLVSGVFHPYEVKANALERTVQSTQFTERDVPIARMGEAQTRISAVRAATLALPRQRIDE